MKKGIDTKIINGNMGIPSRKSLGETKWRKAKPNNRWVDAFTEFYLGINTEDIDHVEVKDECKELPGHIMTLGECENAYIETMNNQTLDWDGLRKGLSKLPFYNDINDPAHIVFLGHELENK